MKERLNHICTKPGHIAKDCRDKDEDKQHEK
jgi:hypothetical protein